jgi:dynein intermediate chain 2
MDAISYEYPKHRREFGIHPQFDDGHSLAQSIASGDEEAQALWVKRITTTVELDCIPRMAQHNANTEMFVQSSFGQSYTEGAWPAEVKTTEFADRQRLLRRIKSEVSYHNAVTGLVKVAEQAIKQNNTIDVFEQYFYHVDKEYANELPSCKTVAVFKDPNEIKRAATCISWHPEDSNKIAVSYSILQFQKTPDKMNLASYIWDLKNPNQPHATILPQSPLCCIKFNPRSNDTIVGGSYNGMVAVWDLRKGSSPIANTVLEHSHHDPVFDIFWIQSRGNNECVSVSTDGRMLWWDIKTLEEGPSDSMMLEAAEGGKVYGGTSLEYNTDGGATRYLVGTEQGTCLLADRKAGKGKDDSTKAVKGLFGIGEGRHLGPVTSIQRNPFNSKYFLTIGDWSCRVWFEDIKVPLMVTKFDGAYLTAGCWSPTRPGVFFTTKDDGTMDVWDLFYQQDYPVFSTKVGSNRITSITVCSDGKHVALGDSNGITTVLLLNGALSDIQEGEKHFIASMFERESKREKNLEASKKGQKKKGKQNKPDNYEEEDEATLASLKEVEEAFSETVVKFRAKNGPDPASDE